MNQATLVNKPFAIEGVSYRLTRKRTLFKEYILETTNGLPLPRELMQLDLLELYKLIHSALERSNQFEKEEE